MVFKKLSKIIDCELKKLKFSNQAIMLGLIFTISLSVALKNIVIGIAIGFVLAVALNEEEKRKNKK